MKAYRVPPAPYETRPFYYLAENEAEFRHTHEPASHHPYEEVPVAEALSHVLAQARSILAPEDLLHDDPLRVDFRSQARGPDSGWVILSIVVHPNGTFTVDGLPIRWAAHFEAFAQAWDRARRFISETGLRPVLPVPL